MTPLPCMNLLAKTDTKNFLCFIHVSANMTTFVAVWKEQSFQNCVDLCRVCVTLISRRASMHGFKVVISDFFLVVLSSIYF